MRDVGNAFMASLNSFFIFLPTLLGAVLLLIVGWIIASVVGKLTRKGLEAAGFERAVAGAGVSSIVRDSRWTATGIVGALVKWFIFLLFVVAAANILGMPQITALMNSIVLFIPRLIVAVLIVIVGSLVARILGGMVHRVLSGSGTGNATLISKMVQYAVIGVSFVAALNQIQVATVVVNTLFIGIVGAACLALGLAFGLGGRDVAARITQSWYSEGLRPKVVEPARQPGREIPPVRRGA